MNLVLKYLAYILFIASLFSLFPIIVGLYYSEPISSFILTAILTVALGVLCLVFSRSIEKKSTSLSLGKGLMLVSLSFIILSALGAIPYLKAFNYDFLNAFFESISGFTTTGLTLFSSLDGLPKSLLFRRAETQWMGGIGIIMVFLFFLSRLKTHSFSSMAEGSSSESGRTLYQAQGFPQHLEGGLKQTTSTILKIYLGYTVLGAILLFFTGMTLLDSIGMTMTSLSTGGFTMSDSPFTSPVQLVILSVLMILGSISFIVHNDLFRKRFKKFITSSEKNVFLLLLVLGIIVVSFSYKDIWVTVFELISSFTTTGYSMTNISALPPLFIMVMMLGMIMGGGVGSTSGGIKVFRITAVFKAIPWLIKRLSSPRRAIIPFKLKGEPCDERDLLIIETFVSAYFMILLLGTLVFLLMGFGFLDSAFQVTSALGTVGLQTMPLIGLPVLGKLVLIVCMLLGRLEIFPFLVMIRLLSRY